MGWGCPGGWPPHPQGRGFADGLAVKAELGGWQKRSRSWGARGLVQFPGGAWGGGCRVEVAMGAAAPRPPRTPTP